jgi:hypothetical protein
MLEENSSYNNINNKRVDDDDDEEREKKGARSVRDVNHRINTKGWSANQWSISYRIFHHEHFPIGRP